MTCNATVIQAFQTGQLGFALSDSGWLMPWYFGVIWALQKVGVINPGSTPIGAVSGGSVAAAASCLGLDFEGYIMPAVQTTAALCRSRNMCAGTLASMMGPSLKTLLMPAASNASLLERCHNSTDIYVSEGHPKIHIARGGSNFAGSTPRRVNSSDADAFVEGIVATWYIPYWSGLNSFATEYQGMPAYEGFYSNPMPCPAGAAVCVRLSSRFPGPLMAKEGTLSSLRSMFDSPSVRAIENVLDIASSRWFDPSEPPAPQPGDIYPGKYNKCKYTPLELAYTMALTPGTKADLDYLFSLGKADGAAWAAEVGLSNLAECSSSSSSGAGAAAAGADGAAVAAGTVDDAAAVIVPESLDLDKAAAAAPELPSSAVAAAESGVVAGPSADDVLVGSTSSVDAAADSVKQQQQSDAVVVSGRSAAVSVAAGVTDAPAADAAASKDAGAAAAAGSVADAVVAGSKGGAAVARSRDVNSAVAASGSPAAKRLPFWMRG